MEGPTPVSALIHAATMVTAGVYLMARVAPCRRCLLRRCLRLRHRGRSQRFVRRHHRLRSERHQAGAGLFDDVAARLHVLGRWFGAYDVGIFHMVTHAFFKALLFLSAGAVIHALHEQQDLKKMGNLRKYIPVTFVAFLIGWLAISGIPPFAGFWSKDEVLLAAWEYNKALWAIGVVTVLAHGVLHEPTVLLGFLRQRPLGQQPEFAR